MHNQFTNWAFYKSQCLFCKACWYLAARAQKIVGLDNYNCLLALQEISISQLLNNNLLGNLIIMLNKYLKCNRYLHITLVCQNRISISISFIISKCICTKKLSYQNNAQCHMQKIKIMKRLKWHNKLIRIFVDLF